MGYKVLVIGESIQSFLSVIRSLGRKGIEVHAAAISNEFPSLRSRYIKKTHTIHSYSLDANKWKAELVALFDRESFDLVIPCHDSSIVPFQEHKKKFGIQGLIFLLEDDCYRIISSKEETYNLALKSGVSVPRQIQLNSLDCSKILKEKFKFPLILKPKTSVTINSLHQRYEVLKVYNKNQIKQHLMFLLKQGSVLVQENFEGTGTGIEFLAFQGEILFAFQHIRIHEKLGGGPSCYRKSIPVMPILLDATKKMIGKLDYTGVGMAEYKIDLDSNKWIFLEINGRFWGSLPLAVAAGANFPYFLFQMMVENRRDFSKEIYEPCVFCRNLILDAAWFFDSLRTKNFGHSFNMLSFKTLLKELKNIFKAQERIDSIVKDDPMPGFIQLRDFFSSIIKGKKPEIPWT